MSQLTISPFSPMWLLCALAIPIAAVLLRRLLPQNRQKRLRFMEYYSYFVFFCWLLYKVFLFIEPYYETNIWTELPFHLCNISIILTPFAARKDSRLLQSFIFFEASLGALLAILMPAAGFEVAVFFSSCGLGYYGTHFMVISLSIFFVALGLYEPKLRDIPKAIAVFVVIGLAAHLLNMVMRATVCADANYFYTYCLPENPILVAIFNVIPIPYIYELVLIPVFMAVNALMTLPFTLVRKKQKRTASITG